MEGVLFSYLKKFISLSILLFMMLISACGGGGGDGNSGNGDNPVYTVTFDSQGATIAANPTSKTVTLPSTTIGVLPTPPTKTGYTFAGWYTAVNGGGTQFISSTPVTKNITVYAFWGSGSAIADNYSKISTAFANGISSAKQSSSDTSNNYHIVTTMHNSDNSVKLVTAVFMDCSPAMLGRQGSYTFNNYTDANGVTLNGTLDYYTTGASATIFVIQGLITASGAAGGSYVYKVISDNGILSGYAGITGCYYNYSTSSTSEIEPSISLPEMPVIVYCGQNVPSLPGAATVTAGIQQLSLKWASITGATAYEVWFSDTNDSESAVQQGGDITTTDYILTGLANATKYYIWLKAKNSAGTSGFGGITSGTTLTVNSNAIAVNGISINRSTVVLTTGDTIQLSPTVIPVDATDKTVNWKSNDTNIVTVTSDGILYAVNDGEVDVTATTSDGGFTGQCKVRVINNRLFSLGYYKDSDNHNNPCYWNNSIEYILSLPSDNKGAYASSMVVVSGTVYVSGYYYNSDNRILPCYWKNSNRIDLPLPEGSQISIDGWTNIVSKIYLSANSNHVYTAGTYTDSAGNQISCYWIEGTRYDLSGPSTISSSLRAMHIYNDDVYLAGCYYNMSTSQVIACYWKNTEKYELNNYYLITMTVVNDNVYTLQGSDGRYISYTKGIDRYSLTSGSPFYNGSYVNSMIVENGTVYISGWYAYGNNVMPSWISCYYINSNERVDLVTPSDSNTSLASMAVSNGNVYSLGSCTAKDNSWSALYYWVNGTTRYTLPQPSGISGETPTIIVQNGNVYTEFVTTDNLLNPRTPCYWINTSRYDLSLPSDNQGAYACEFKVLNNDVYISGCFKNSENSIIPCIWINANRYDLILPDQSLAGGTNSIIVE